MKVLKPKRRTIKFKGKAGHVYRERVGKSLLPDKFAPGPRHGKAADLYKSVS